MEKCILGLDPGLATLGFGVICANVKESKRDRTLDYGVIKTSASIKIEKRLQIIYEDLQSLITKWSPSLAVIEKLFFYRMTNILLIAQARGVLILVLAQNNIYCWLTISYPLAHDLTTCVARRCLSSYSIARVGMYWHI
ncbi:MAG: crossover junction endodeoxyribonuclease RuvC [Hormoscilla sp. SP5CHS1]|nr:crossover junction endodeoxyribonuclease RuvC [Hormoscilla sp. SP5CHS1]